MHGSLYAVVVPRSASTESVPHAHDTNRRRTPTSKPPRQRCKAPRRSIRRIGPRSTIRSNSRSRSCSIGSRRPNAPRSCSTTSSGSRSPRSAVTTRAAWRGRTGATAAPDRSDPPPRHRDRRPSTPRRTRGRRTVHRRVQGRRPQPAHGDTRSRHRRRCKVLLGFGPLPAAVGRPMITQRLLGLFGPASNAVLVPVSLEREAGFVAFMHRRVAVVRLREIDGLIHHIHAVVIPPTDAASPASETT